MTDFVLIVVAADEGVQSQTIEAIRFARKRSLKIIVGISKIDKPEANIDLVKSQLAENNLPVDQGDSDVSWLAFSAQTGEGC